jgi:pimeloyl-ACP methyl ester carboxylesterase
VAAWSALARQVERRAAAALAAGHAVSAREAYLRAYVYHRAALTFINPFDAATARPAWLHAVDCFRRSAALMEPVVEPVSVPCGGVGLPGYFVAPGDGQAKRKTLIMIGGGDTYVEDLYLMIGQAAVKRGYNLLIVDLPGQGGLPFDGLYMQPGTETQLPPVVDYALSRPEVDGAQLAAYGISYGGYILPRALSAEKRIQATAVCSVLSDFHAWMTQTPMSERFAKNLDSLPVKAIVRMRNLKPSLILLDTYAWRWGASRYADLLDIAKDFTLDPAGITCPLLSIVGEKEYANSAVSRRFQDEAIKANPDPRSRLIVVKASDGGDAHAIGTNLSLMAQLVFDWLDEVLSPKPSTRSGLPQPAQHGRAGFQTQSGPGTAEFLPLRRNRPSGRTHAEPTGAMPRHCGAGQVSQPVVAGGDPDGPCPVAMACCGDVSAARISGRNPGCRSASRATARQAGQDASANPAAAWRLPRRANQNTMPAATITASAASAGPVAACRKCTEADPRK